MNNLGNDALVGASATSTLVVDWGLLGGDGRSDRNGGVGVHGDEVLDRGFC